MAIQRQKPTQSFKGLLSLSVACATLMMIPEPSFAQGRYSAQRTAQQPQMMHPHRVPAYQQRVVVMPQQHHYAPYPTAYRSPMQFQRWVDWEPQYTLVPGDQLDIVVSSAPELSRTLTVGPDGRVVMPMSQPIMAAGKTFTQLQHALMGELAKQLRDPRIAVTPRAYAPEQIFVGGQVGQPGTYTLASPIGALEAILMAGGLRPTAKGKEVVVLRRAPNGGVMMRTVNIKGGLKDIRRYDDVIQLKRGDVVFVPATGLAEVGMFVQNLRAALPVDFNLSYQFGQDGGNGTTVITP